MLPSKAAPLAAEPAAPQWAEQLVRNGFCIVEDAVPLDLVEALDRDLATAFAETPFCQGGFYGGLTKRFGRLLSRSGHAEAFVRHPLIMDLVEKLLGPWCDTIQLNLTQAIALHPGALSQLPHRDQDMWRGAIGETEYLVNVMWPFADYTSDNGATLIWPGSHGKAAVEPDPVTAPIVATMKPGSALLFLGSTLHGGGGNRSSTVRRGMIVSYCLGWLKPYENQWLAYPPDIAKRFDPELAALVGYRQHRPNLGNIEGQCPSILFKGPLDMPVGAIDELRPDQQTLLDLYIAGQRRAP